MNYTLDLKLKGTKTIKRRKKDNISLLLGGVKDMLRDRSFNGNRLKSARIYRGITITELAEKLGVSKQMISKYESNKSVPSFESLLIIIDILDFPRDYFFEEDLINLQINDTYFQSLAFTTKKEQQMQNDRIKFLAVIRQLLEKYIEFPTLDIPEINNQELLNGELIAERLREHWGLADEPITSVVRLLEKKGFIVVSPDIKISGINAFSQKKVINGKDYYFIVLGDDDGVAVKRQSSAAHELGRMILRETYIDMAKVDKEQIREIENEAQEFAAAFLLPKEAYTQDIVLHPLDLDYYVHLKKKWCVSIFAMTVRSYKLGIITKSQYQYLQRKINQRGWRKSEPLDHTLKLFVPIAFEKAIRLLQDNNILSGYAVVEMLSKKYQLSLHPKEIESLLGLVPGMLAPIKSVRCDNIVRIKKLEQGIDK